MTSPEHYEGAADSVEAARQEIDLINSLQTRIGEHGHLSNLVVNLRNRYLSSPEGVALNAEVQPLVEGFLAEIALIRGEHERMLGDLKDLKMVYRSAQSENVVPLFSQEGVVASILDGTYSRRKKT